MTHIRKIKEVPRENAMATQKKNQKKLEGELNKTKNIKK